jgi:hypothetical protein
MNADISVVPREAKPVIPTEGRLRPPGIFIEFRAMKDFSLRSK